MYSCSSSWALKINMQRPETFFTWVSYWNSLLVFIFFQSWFCLCVALGLQAEMIFTPLGLVLKDTWMSKARWLSAENPGRLRSWRIKSRRQKIGEHRCRRKDPINLVKSWSAVYQLHQRSRVSECFPMHQSQPTGCGFIAGWLRFGSNVRWAIISEAHFNPIQMFLRWKWLPIFILKGW